MVGLIWVKMLDTVKQKIQQLIAAYEAEKMERTRLQSALDQANAENEACRKQITELERQIDNLKLAEAFKASGAGSPEAKKKISSLMKEIDRCISLLEG
jgi:predicted nuclease with TOPRIM domain